jgi:hypothetical protein
MKPKLRYDKESDIPAGERAFYIKESETSEAYVLDPDVIATGNEALERNRNDFRSQFETERSLKDAAQRELQEANRRNRTLADEVNKVKKPDSLVLDKDEAGKWRTYTQLGTPEELTTIKDEHTKYKAHGTPEQVTASVGERDRLVKETAEHKEGDLLRRVASAEDFDADVLSDLVTHPVRGMVTVKDDEGKEKQVKVSSLFRIKMVKESEDSDKKVAAAFITIVGDDGDSKEMRVKEYASERADWAKHFSSLTGGNGSGSSDDGDSSRRGGESGGGSTGGQTRVPAESGSRSGGGSAGGSTGSVLKEHLKQKKEKLKDDKPKI